MIASGHFRSGLQWSIGTALCVAALLRGDTPPIDLKVFHPGR
jgi:glycine/D-amino acid oxidase-like deaminating enzyme